MNPNVDHSHLLIGGLGGVALKYYQTMDVEKTDILHIYPVGAAGGIMGALVSDYVIPGGSNPIILFISGIIGSIVFDKFLIRP